MAYRAGIGLLIALLALPAEPAAAQNSWQSMFGYGSAPRAYNYPGMSPYRLRSPHGSLFSPYQSYGEEEVQPPAQGGTYRTLCVRLCDGYYFPISSAAAQHGLARDADACSASCGAEARLFYHPSIGGDVDTMVDLTGMAYGAIGNAFKYRKTLVEGCRCRPQPWSQAERERHRTYVEGQSAMASAPRDAEVIAGGDRTRTDPSNEPPAAASPRALFRLDE